MKRILSAVLSVVLVLGMIPAALAASGEHQKAADNLYQLGLVSGTGTDANGNPIYELDRAPTRSEAITVLVKLLGKADEASVGEWKTPFTDVPGWAQNFVGYAYANGLTSGTSATTFGGDDPVTAAQYITFVLKALGYSANGDFQWDRAWELSDKLGITGGRYNAETKTFLRGDVFFISEAALHINVKNSSQTLAQQLIAAEVFSKSLFNQVYDVTMQELSAEEIFAQCSPAVFFVEVYNEAGKALGTGSGFFLNSNGLAVTNHHVLDGAARAVITTSDTQKRYEVKGVYDFDKQNDWVVMQVDGTGFKSLDIGSMDTVQGGATVFAIGSPKGLQNTISQGLISNPDRELDGVHYIQTSAPISPGSSGGALINRFGQAVGITSAGFTDGQNLNLAMPITVIENHTTSKLLPISAVTTKPSVSYQLDKTSVSVEVGKSVLVSMNANDTNIGDTVTYSVKSDDKTIATVVWDDMEDEYLPWDIRITGIKAGKTALTITNDITNDTISIPITVTAPMVSVSYQLDAQSVALIAGNSKLVSMNAIVNGTNDTVTHSIKSGDESIATVAWNDMTDKYLPWDIRITGHKVGKTTLTIYNDMTTDTISIPIVVTAPVGRQAAAYNVLKLFICNNYTKTIGDDRDKTYEYKSGNYTYQLIYSEKYDDITLGERGPNATSYISIKSTGQSFFSSLFFYDSAYGTEWSFYGNRDINAPTFHLNSTVNFTDYEGYVGGKMAELRYLSNLMIMDSLEFTNYIFEYNGTPGFSMKDFGFDCFD